MLQNIDLKLIFATLASVITIVAYYPYIKDIFLKKTKPHVYTWLIWAITAGTATMGAWRGGGKNSVIGMSVIFLLIMTIVVLSIKYGTKNITKSDTIVLLLALSSIFIWWQLNNPVLAIIMVTVVDVFGYWPTYRKTWVAPEKETLSFWVMITIVSILIFLSIAEYNLLTTLYAGAMVIADSILVAVLYFRRKVVAKGVLKNNFK